ncbi:EamA family transporter [Hydrogenophaga sp.]
MRSEALALLAAPCWAVAALFPAPASQRLGAFNFSRWRMLLACLILWAVALSTGSWRRLHASAWGLLAVSLILHAMKLGQAGLVAVLSSVTPILILPLLWLIYRRRPAVGAGCGALLAVAGTAMMLT